MDSAARLVIAAQRAADRRAFRAAALAIIAQEIPHDAAFFHALSPRVPLDTGVWNDLDLAIVAESARHWDQWAVDLARLRDVAMDRGGVAVDVEVFGPSRKKFAYYELLARPLRLSAMMLAHLTVADRILAVVGLCKRRGSFEGHDTETMRALVPVLSIADAARRDDVADRGVPVSRLRCEDQRLTERQRELVEHVALGHTNGEIARALGISQNSVRNQLAAVFKRLGAANRAEAVRLAVLR